MIGPNGAGKTTLTSLLSGDLPPYLGQHLLDGEDIAGLRPTASTAFGVGRSYQKTNIFLPFTVFENCRIAAQSRLPSSMRFIRSAHAYGEVNAWPSAHWPTWGWAHGAERGRNALARRAAPA